MSKKQLINIILAILFSVSGIVFLIKKSNTTYIKTEEGLGNYQKKINADNTIEYKEYKNGNYDKLTFAKVINSIKINTTFYLGLLLAIIAMFGRDIGYTIRLRILSDHQLSWKKCIQTILLWEFSSAISPGTVGGSAIAMFIINKEGIPLSKSTSIVFIATLFDNLFYVIIVPVILLLIPNDSLFPYSLINMGFTKNTFLLGYFIIVCITILFAYSLFISSEWIKFILNKTVSFKLLKKWSNQIEIFSEKLIISNNELKKKPLQFWLKILVSTFFSWISRFLVINSIILAFGEVNINNQLLILGKQSVMWIILLITPIPGGSGIAEFMFSTFFKDNSGIEIITSIQAIIWRVISYYPYIIIGLILLPKFILKQQKV